MLGERTVYTVSDVNRYIKNIISNDQNLKFISVRGEISNLKKAMNGHFYFSLKDKDANISCMLFANYARELNFAPVDGDEVVVLASVDFYQARGNCSLIVYQMQEVGKGALLIALEKLKKQLQKEGLFDESRKRKINTYPKSIGVITAKNSAAIKDIIYNINRRYPLCQIYFFPSSVQGDNAPKELLAAFNKTQQYDLDTLIIGRGGGASEDLNAFNDEKLVRALSLSKTPIIAAIGHEIDFTLVDFVADKRASTPTAAAELATADINEIRAKFHDWDENMKKHLINKLDDMKKDVQEAKEDLSLEFKRYFEDLKKDIENRKKTLEAINPKAILKRGYSISQLENGTIIKTTKDVKPGQKIVTVLADGNIISEVNEIKAE